MQRKYEYNLSRPQNSGMTTGQKESSRSEIAKFFTTDSSRKEAEESARAMIARGYPPDLVYAELDRQFPKPKEGELTLAEALARALAGE